MRNGGGKAKGSAWEREVGRRLSMWLTENQRTNIFARNVLSGGGFTVTAQKGRETPNVPGDLMAASPLAFEFLTHFSIECKHRNDIDLDTFIRDKKGTSFLSKTIQHTRAQARDHGVNWLVIAKQNRYEPIVLMENRIGREAILASSFPTMLRYHTLFNDEYMLLTLDHLTRLTTARRFIKGVIAGGHSQYKE